jgi:mannosyltransferase
VADRDRLPGRGVSAATTEEPPVSAATAPAAPREPGAPVGGLPLWKRHPAIASALGVLALMLASVWLRTHAITAKFWIDEGLSVGIAHHDFWSIPGVLRKDGAPPLYYMLLNVWMGIVGGDGESRIHALSVIFAVLTVPAGWWAGRRLFGVRAGWATAALCATVPFLTYYAQEARMYALVALLGLVASATFAMTYGERDRRMLPLFVVATALTVYTHNWGLFMTAGMGLAWLVLLATAHGEERRGLWRDGLIGFGAIAVLYLPWVPRLLFQAAHTGAPWAERPPLHAVLNGMQTLVGGVDTALMIGLVGGAGILALRADAEGRPRSRAALSLAIIALSGIMLAWLASQASPAWAMRYFAVFIGPGMLLAGAGLVRFGTVGLVALAVVLVLWFDPHESQIRGKSDAYRVARTLKDQNLINERDLVLAVHPEYGPTMRYYLGPSYRYADAMGKVSDARVFDWRDALDRLKAAGPRRTLDQLAPSVQPGQHLILIEPIIRTAKWGAPWTSLVRRRAAQWERAVDHDPRFQRVAPIPSFKDRPLPRGVRAVVYLRR